MWTKIYMFVVLFFCNVRQSFYIISSIPVCDYRGIFQIPISNHTCPSKTNTKYSIVGYKRLVYPKVIWVEPCQPLTSYMCHRQTAKWTFCTICSFGKAVSPKKGMRCRSSPEHPTRTDVLCWWMFQVAALGHTCCDGS